MTSTNTTIAKIAALVAGFGLVAMSFAIAPAHAQTTSPTNAQLQAQIQALLAQIAALQAQLSGGASVSVTFTRDLTMGSRGADVTSLQTWLIGKGFSIPAGATGYFGAQTRAALAAFQAANGIAPAAGYFGPITRGRIIAMIATSMNPGNPGTPGTPSNNGALQGGAGRLTDLDMLGDITSDLHEGDAVTRVIGFSATADDSDVMVQRVDTTFTIGGSDSSNLDRYIDSVSLYQDGTKLATLDASSGDKDGRVWTFRFSDLHGVIREGKTSNFYIEVTPVSSIGSAETGETITVALPTDPLRAVDAEGISETYTPSGTRTQSFSVSTATTGTVTITAANNNPVDSQVEVDDTDTTTDVTLLSFNLKAKNQDVTVADIPVQISTSDNNVSDVISTVRLMKGSTTLRSKTVTTGSTNTIVFDNVDLDLNEDTTATYSVVADIRPTTAYTTGTTITASTTANLSGFDVSDSNGDTATLSGSAVGGTITLSTTGISVARNSATTQTTTGLAGAGDTTQYSISFSVTAGDEDIFIDRSIQSTTTPTIAGGGVAWATTTSSTSGVTNQGVASFSASDTNTSDTTTSFRIPAGTTRTFTLNVSLTATGSGFTGVMLTGINYDTDTNTNDSTLYYTANLDTFKTNDVFMAMR
jgi:peptidoglycan hydrolase-like protein with peptidoglycan-binding domain